MTHRLVPTLLAIVLIAGCATPEPPPPPPAPSPAPKVDATPKKEPETESHGPKLKHLANRNLKPIETRRLNTKASCDFRDPTGYRGKLRLDVKEASVKSFEANVDVPKRGSCNFRLKDFNQTHSDPIVILSARQGDCKVRLWEQENQVTVAFRDCRTECSGTSVDYLWPILVDNRKGSCS
jgi:hypothetical protein